MMALLNTVSLTLKWSFGGQPFQNSIDVAAVVAAVVGLDL